MRIVRLARTLSFHLFLLLLGVLLVVFIIYAYVNVRTQTTHLMSTVMEHANSTGDLIKRSTRYSMLLNRREDVYQIIKALGDQPGVEGIRIYNKKGEIMFSTNSTEIKTMVDMSAEACNICHVGKGPIESPAGSLRSRVYNSNNGHRVLGIIHAIRNEPDCYTAECHYHSANQTVLGVLDVKMSLATVDSQIQEIAELYDGCADRVYHFLLVRLGTKRKMPTMRCRKHSSGWSGTGESWRRSTTSMPTCLRSPETRPRDWPLVGATPAGQRPLVGEELFCASPGDGEAREAAEIVAVALGQLSVELREVVELKTFAGLTFQQISQATGLPQGP